MTVLNDNEMTQYLAFRSDNEREVEGAVKLVGIEDQYGWSGSGIRLTPALTGTIMDWLHESIRAYGEGRGIGLDGDEDVEIGPYGIVITDHVYVGSGDYERSLHCLSLEELCDPYGTGKARREIAEQEERERKEAEERRAQEARERHARTLTASKRQNLDKLAEEFGYALVPLSEIPT